MSDFQEKTRYLYVWSDSEENASNKALKLRAEMNACGLWNDPVFRGFCFPTLETS